METVNLQEVLLGTIELLVLNQYGHYFSVRALCDTGSQLNFITQNAVQMVQANMIRSCMNVAGIGGEIALKPTNMVTCVIKNKDGGFSISITASVVKAITCKLPVADMDVTEWAHLADLKLADPKFNKSAPIDLMLGAGVWAEIIENSIIRGFQNEPSAQLTKFGWVVFGVVNQYKKTAVNLSATVSNDELDESLQLFWEIENISGKNLRTQEQELCERVFVQSIKQTRSGRYQVDMPIRSVDVLGESKKAALRRLFQMENKFKKDKLLCESYQKFMAEYELLGHMRKAMSNERGNLLYYIPHHAVSIENKFRVVFDASVKTSTGVSLNDIQMIGEKLQSDLPIVISRFRMHKVAFTADITKMYRQVLISDCHTQYQHIFWRAEPTMPIEEYILLTVTYGTRAAPHTAIRTLLQCADHSSKDLPSAAHAIRSNFYVDDVLSGASTVKEAVKLYLDLIKALEVGKFQLAKLMSNDLEVLRAFKVAPSDNEVFKFSDNATTNVLGLYWNPKNDVFKFKTSEMVNDKNTKRQILAAIAKLYDPVGFITPVIVKAKLIIQKLWRLQVKWDDLVPDEIKIEWETYKEEFGKINDLTIPRWLHYTEEGSMEMYIFCDASSKAYGVVCYIGCGAQDGEKTVHLLMSRSRVAPLKTLTIPRLELCAAHIGAKMGRVLMSELKLEPTNSYFWTDSTIVLCWLKKQPALLTTFVANRTAEIQELTEESKWSHVQSHENPADLISRGCSPQDLRVNKLWWHGPKWLKSSAECWRADPILTSNDLQIAEKEVKKVVLTSCKKYCAFLSTQKGELTDVFSSINKIDRVTAVVMRFIKRLREKRAILGNLSQDELVEARLQWVKHLQTVSFAEEKKCCIEHKSLPSDSKLLRLSPFLDKQGILRMSSRLVYSDLSYDEKFPILLPNDHNYVKLLIDEAHIAMKHGGCQQMLQYLRSRYWIISLRKNIKKCLNRCITCVKMRQKTAHQLMAPLPAVRVTPGRCFKESGVDYFGPLLLKARGGRCPIFTKGYGAIFVCMKTKAVHLELVSELSTSAFLATFKRFTSRRGNCVCLYSDNGTNFVGAASEFTAIRKALCIATDSDEWKKSGTTFRFNTPSAPHQGGLWEAAVKSAKKHLQRIIGNTKLTFEEMSTVLTEIEACLNSRPLVKLTDDPSDQLALTPAHFLIGEMLVAPLSKDLTEISMNRINRWKLLQQMTQRFWKQWSQDYVNQLAQRSKWQTKQVNIKVGDIVIIKLESTSPLKWPLGRVTDVHPGADNLVRKVSVLFNNKIYERPISKICLLPVESDGV